MTENKRYTLNREGIDDLDEYGLESPILLGEDVLTFGEIIDKLNVQEETMNELKTRNKRQYERLKNIGDLMFKRDWETLGLIVDKWEKEEEQLRKYGG